MMRSLFSGVAGLKTHQTKMDVIGNNIANVNTVGFKSSTVNFSDVLYQTTQSASGANEVTGAAGTNAKQIGLGSGLASITSSMTTAGGSQTTDNPLDVMISGDAFFVVKSGGTNYFTKDGSFKIDANGTLCTSSGATVQGWMVDDQTGEVVRAAVQDLTVMAPKFLYSAPEATTDAYLSGNIDKNDTSLTSTGINVQPTFYDKLGNAYTAQLNIKQTDVTSQYTVNVTDILDSNGNSIFVTATTNTDGSVTYSTDGAQVATVTLGGIEYTCEVSDDGSSYTIVGPEDGDDCVMLEFSGSNGKFVGTNVATPNETDLLSILGEKVTMAFLTDDTVANPFEDLSIDFSSLTMYSTSGSSSIEPTRGAINGSGAGYPAGNMSGISIDQSGKIYGTYDNGTSRLLGQIVTASFTNPSGLEAVGSNMFAQTQNSGEFDGIGQDPTAGGGKLTTGVLEMSNVDLSTEFTQMIVTQRGFQANSRIITTSDTMLEELINLKR
ncbi:MAG: flagellar hook protein FlgE [Lachnospiraceae bacterium]|nr:flagellar hook protein FlgE [Lachnospiraceae bacterium]